MYHTEAEQRGTCQHWRFPWENSDADGGKVFIDWEQRSFLVHLFWCWVFFFWRLWYVTSWDKKTLSEFAGGDLFLSSNLDVCPSVLPILSFSVY